MSTNLPNPADNTADEPQGKAHVAGPSLEEVIDRVKRVRPQPVSSLRHTVPDLAGQTIGCYTLRRVVGQGAFGVVYQAHDEQLGRDVALKFPRPEVLFDEERLLRFESEAATAATLEHPSIVPIFEADLTGPTPYIASSYCEGPDLGKWLDEHGTSIPIEQVAKFVIKLSEAVHYAHRQGVLHRDLKPGNILLQPCHDLGISGNQLEHFKPKLTDFGLAKLLESDGEDTRSSMMLGTPRYMAPEQIDKRIGEVGVETDIHALGTILYELLLGQTTYKDSSHVELLLAIRERQVTPPSRIRPSVTPTLEAICLKALEKRPQARYSTALELAEDLGRYLRGEPTVAKPLALPSRAAKWIRLNPWVASLLAVVSVSILGLVLGVSWHNHRLSNQLAVSDRLRIESADNANQSDRLRVEAVENARKFLRARYVADIQLTQQALSTGRFSEARSRLEKYQPGSDGEIVSDFAWHLLNDQLNKTLIDFQFEGPLRTLATSDLLKASVTGGEDGMLRLFDTATGVQLAKIEAHQGNVNAIAFTANETTLVSGGDDGMLCVWDTSSLHVNGEIVLIRSHKAHNDDLLCLAVAPDSKLIASGSADNTVRLWKFDDLKPAGELLGHTDWVRALDFSPDGLTLASGSHDTTIRRWDLETKKDFDQFTSDELVEDKDKECVYCLQHHPTEPLIVAGYKDHMLRFWDLSTGKERQQINVFNDWVRALSISANGNRIVASADETRIMLFERSASGNYEQTQVLFTERTKNMGVAFTNSDSQIVSAGTMGASIWSTDNELAGEAICELKCGPICMTGPADENEVMLVTQLGTNKVNLNNGSNFELLLGKQDAGISKDGSWVVSSDWASKEGHIRIRLNKMGKNSGHVLYSGVGDSKGLAISPSGEHVAAATPDHSIRIWQAPDCKQETIVRNPFENSFKDIFINNTGTQLFLLPRFSRQMIVFDVATSEQVANLDNVEDILIQSIDGQRLAVFRSDYSVAIYDTQVHQIVQTVPSHANEVIGACFSPVEPLVATITSEGEITLWALDTGEMLIHFQAGFSKKTGWGAYLAFTSNGRTLVAAGGMDDKGEDVYTELRAWRATPPQRTESID